MKKLAWSVMVLGLIVCVVTNVQAGNFPNPGAAPVIVTNPPSNPVPVTGNVTVTGAPPSPCCYRFVGFSSAITSGTAGGQQGMNALCRATYPTRPDVRICTTQEYLSTASAHTSVYDAAWLRPTSILYLPPTYIPFCTSYVVATDPASGVSHCGSSIDCDQWGNLAGRGLTVDIPSHNVSSRPCAESHPVACCAP
jgi:hypothetical protein